MWWNTTAIRPQYDFTTTRESIYQAARFMPAPALEAVTNYLQSVSDQDVNNLIAHSRLRTPYIEFQELVSVQCNLKEMLVNEVRTLPGLGEAKASYLVPNINFVIMQWPYDAFHMMHNSEEWLNRFQRQKCVFTKAKAAYDRKRYTTQDLRTVRNWLHGFYPKDAPQTLDGMVELLRGKIPPSPYE